MEKTGAKAKNTLILSAIFGIVENVIKAEKKNKLTIKKFQTCEKLHHVE